MEEIVLLSFYFHFFFHFQWGWQLNFIIFSFIFFICKKKKFLNYLFYSLTFFGLRYKRYLNYLLFRTRGVELVSYFISRFPKLPSDLFLVFSFSFSWTRIHFPILFL